MKNRARITTMRIVSASLAAAALTAGMATSVNAATDQPTERSVSQARELGTDWGPVDDEVGVAVKVTNRSHQPIVVLPSKGAFSATGSAKTTLNAGQSTWIADHWAADGPDLWGKVRFSKAATNVDFWGYRPAIGRDSFGLGTNLTKAGNWDRYCVGDVKNKTENGHQFTVKREDDKEGYTRFVLEVRS